MAEGNEQCRLPTLKGVLLRSAPGTARGTGTERVGARSQQLHPLLNKPGFRSDHPGVWRLYFREGFCGSKSWESGTAHFGVPSLLALWARVARRLSGDPVLMAQGFWGREGLFFCGGTEPCGRRSRDFSGHAVFMRQKRWKVSGWELLAGCDCHGGNSRRKSIGWAGRTGDRPGSENLPSPARACCGRCRTGRVFQSATGPASDWLWAGRTRNT